tara:strand:- start:592 stop:1374 length:783 start_codon:yes stop_codon:yes gene_type:complete
MKKIILTFLTFVLTFSISENSFADDQYSEMEGNVFNIQVQQCTLKGDTSIKQYDSMINDYFKWAKKNDAEVFFSRQTPLYVHNSWYRSGIDFLEILFSTHAESGKAWDKWLGTKEGQKLNARWQELADCRVKMGASFINYIDQEAMNNDNDRIVSWNWCSLNEGVSYEDLLTEHEKRAELLKEDSLGMIAWANVYPNIGTDEAPGDFAHLAVYPNIESAQIYQQSQSSGGWQSYRDYQRDFATCKGESYMIEKVLNDPNN